LPKPPDRLPKDAVDRLVRLAKEVDLPDPEPRPGVAQFVFPLVRREFRQRPPWVEPLRRGYDYQGSARPTLLVHQCDVCGGGMAEPDAHERDPDACEREKVRQVMES